MGDQKKILVFETRAKGTARSDLYEVTEKELDDILDNNPNLQATTIATHGESHIEIRQKHLYTPEQQELYKVYPNYETSIARVKTKGHSTLTILSKNKSGRDDLGVEGETEEAK